MIQVQRFNKVLKLAVILGDLVILNVLFISFNSIWNELFGERACSGTLPQILTLFSVCYFACTISGGVILHRRGARADQIVFRVLRNVFYFSFLSTGLMVLSELEIYSKRFFIYYFILLILCITVYRLLFRFCIQLYRSHGGNFRTVLYLGSTENIAELYHEMTSDATTGYRVLGYFDTTPNAKFPASCTYLGKPEQAIDYLAQHKVNQLYCCLPSALSEQIVPVINYCENNLIHFYSVPNVRILVDHPVNGLYLADDLFQPAVQVICVHTLPHGAHLLSLQGTLFLLLSSKQGSLSSRAPPCKSPTAPVQDTIGGISFPRGSPLPD